MEIISTNTKGRNEYEVFSTSHQILHQGSAESTAAESHTATDALPSTRTAGIKACVEHNGGSLEYRKGLPKRAKTTQASSKHC